jgi:hypothetical protein
MKDLIKFLLIVTLFACRNESNNQKLGDEHKQIKLNTQGSPIAKTPSFDFIKTFAGKIDNKYPLHLKMTSDNGDITGRYFYDKNGVDIEVKGTISKDSTITLNEFDLKGNQTGLWKGKLINENKIIGTWSKPRGNLTQIFTLILTYDNYESAKKALLDSKYSEYNGTYVVNEESPYGVTKFLKIKYTENNEIEFDISTATSLGCTGELKETAKINSSGTATYSGFDCNSLSFKFNDNEIIVQEDDCMMHGVGCSFIGTYTK